MPPTMSAADQLPHLLRYVDRVVPSEGLTEKLERPRPLRVKLGVDPTASAVTLGWAVVLRKLRHFQEMGHIAVLIIGDFTARVGDPSERSETRRRLTADEVNDHAEMVLGQFQKILLPENLEIRRNSEWLARLEMTDILELASAATVAQMLERSDFARRYGDGVPISVLEFLYPLLQGYDSVAVESDVELGGADQLWNLMMGRAVQERYGQEPQVAVTMPILVGVDGGRLMGQSLDNYVGVEDDPAEMFGRTMSIPDDVMPQWFRLAADRDPEDVAEIEAGLKSGELHPGETKRRLARDIVALYWGGEAAITAEMAFDRVFKEGDTPEDVDDFALGERDPVNLPALIREVFSCSGSEARRLIAQGAVTLDGEAFEDLEVPRVDVLGKILRVGKRRFIRLVE
jgi:tyrosyl-tRNA synthetase